MYISAILDFVDDDFLLFIPYSCISCSDHSCPC